MESYQYFNISSASPYTVSSKDQGVLHSIVVNKTSASPITVTDNSGTMLTLKASIVEGTYLYDVAYSGYLAVDADGASDITVCYS